MIACLLSVGALAGCEKQVKSSQDGVLLTYFDEDGNEHSIKADKILSDYYDDSSKYQTIYDTIYSVVVRNYFAKEREPGVLYEGAKPEPLGLSQMDEINAEAEDKVSIDEETAKSNAEANNTRYKKELQAILDSKGVNDTDELKQKYVEELQKEKFEDNFYTYCLEELKSADNGNTKTITTKIDDETSFTFDWNGYINDELPYHVSHVMVALDDTSDTNYYNGTISSDNAKKLYNVVNDLGDPNKSFSAVAVDKSDDTGSGAKQGDLGIMDYDTSFISEFKLGVYAYEQFYAENTSEVNDAIKMDKKDDSDKVIYKKTVAETFDIGADEIPTVNYNVFKDLFSYAEKDNDKDGEAVIEGSSLVKPRNIIYNKYLNIHSVYFIEKSGDDLDDEIALGAKSKYRRLNGVSTNPYVLHAEINGEYKPVIAVRGSSQDKQEIHFIVINRSPYENDLLGNPTLPNRSVSGVSLSEYYTTFYPAEAGYPKDTNSKAKQTYVNFLSNEDSKTKARAEEFASKLKSYDSDKIGKYIFLKYLNEEKITFGDNKTLAKALMNWIKTSLDKKSEEKKENWEKTVNDYLDKLDRQNAERSKLIPQVGTFLYEHANENKSVYAVLGATAYAEHKAELVEAVLVSGKAADDTEAENYLGEHGEDKATPLCDWYKVKGGIFNDGKAHL